MDDNKKTKAIHLNREILTREAKAAAAEEKEYEERAAKLKQIEEDARKQMETVFRPFQRPGVVSEPPDLSAGDPEFEKRFEEILRGIPDAPKKGDKISRKEITESIARCLRGDLSRREISEGEMKAALALMSEIDRCHERQRKENRELLFAALLVTVLFVAVVLLFIFNPLGV